MPEILGHASHGPQKPEVGQGAQPVQEHRVQGRYLFQLLRTGLFGGHADKGLKHRNERSSHQQDQPDGPGVPQRQNENDRRDDPNPHHRGLVACQRGDQHVQFFGK